MRIIKQTRKPMLFVKWWWLTSQNYLNWVLQAEVMPLVSLKLKVVKMKELTIKTAFFIKTINS
jgi:hypothetical protein